MIAVIKHTLSSQPAQRSAAVAETIRLEAHGVEHGDVQVAQGGAAFETDVAAGPDRAAAFAGQNDRQVVVVVAVSVADTAAHHHHAMIQQRALPLGGCS